MATVTDYYNQLIAGYAPVFDNNAQLVQSQADYGQAQKTALDQQKVNAFRQFLNNRNAAGLMFSGLPIQDQTQFVGEKYIPALAQVDLKTAQDQAKIQAAELQMRNKLFEQAQKAEQIANTPVYQTVYN
jgi:hypothetical protein